MDRKELFQWIYFAVTVTLLLIAVYYNRKYYELATDCCNNWEKICLRVNTSSGIDPRELERIIEQISPQEGRLPQNRTQSG